MIEALFPFPSRYKKQALKWHPDKNPDRQQEAEVNISTFYTFGGYLMSSIFQRMFKLIKEAQQVLTDADKRAHYDLFGHQEAPPPGMQAK